MADTFSNWLKARFIQTGTDPNTWGSILNTDVFALFDQAITGQSTISLGSATTYSMPAMSNGAASNSRSLVITFTGSPASAVTVTLPASVNGKFYIVDNQCGQTITLTYAASSNTTDILTGKRQIVWADGTDVWPIFASASDASTLGGVAAANYARLDQANVFTKANSSAFVTVTEAPTTTINAALGNNQILTLTGNRTMAAPSNPADGEPLYLLVQQDGTGGRTLSWNSVFLFESGAAPILSTVGGTLDLFVMVYNSALTKWIAGHFSAISAGSGATYSYTIAENTIDWNLLAKVGSPGGAITVNVTIPSGVIVQATTTGTPALDLSGLPNGSTVNLLNSGYVIGKGGKGGDGAVYATDFYQQDQTVVYGDNGANGGNAVVGPGLGNTFNVTNNNGKIYGGGGGGGGGGTDFILNATVSGLGGGGGGGAGGGEAGFGKGGSHAGVAAHASNGNPGKTGPNGGGGAGGAGTSVGLAGYSGGDGGAFGTAGVDATGSANSFGTGGPAGKAIELGGGAITWISGSGNVAGAVS